MRSAEAITAGLLSALGLLVALDSACVGRGWAPDGPEAGFYPFYVGLTLAVAAGWILLRSLRTRGLEAPFASTQQLRRVLCVFLPSAAFVAALYVVGIYVAALLFMIGFMHWQGAYRWYKALPVALAVTLVLFALFELWFKVPRPKGPLEASLGY